VEARAKLKAALEKLNPAGGILDDGDGSGRHSKNREKKAKKAKKDQSGDAGSDPSSE
jgi:hypothetical protein